MHSYRMKRNVLLLILALFMTVTACQSSEAKVQKHLDTAQVMIEAGDYEVARIELLNALKADPSSSKAYFLLGRALAGMKDHNSAASALANANELAPNDRQIALEYARYLMLGRAYNLAEPVLEKWVTDHPDDGEFLKLLSLAQAYLGNRAGSLEYANRAVDVAPEDAGSWLNLVQVHLINRDQAGVERALRRAEELSPESVPVALMRISLLGSQGRRDEAVKRMKDLTAANPDQVNLHIRLAGMYETIGRDEEAVKVYRQVVESGPNALAFHRLGILLYKGDQKEEALGFWAKSVETDPYYRGPRLDMARHFMTEGDPSQALATVNEALKYAPNDTQALALRGQIHLVEGRVGEAAADLQKALEIRPDVIQWRLWLSRAQLSTSEIVSARENLRIILDKEPDHAEANVLLARIEASSANFEESSSFARAASSDSVHGRQAMWILGDNALRRQMLPQAKGFYARNIDRHGPHPGTVFRLARCRELLGELKEAEADYHNLLNDYPDDILPLTQLVSLLGRTGREDEALALAREKAGSKGFSQLLLLGRVLEGTGNNEEARDVYLSLVQSHPDRLAPYQRIIGIYARESNLEGAQGWLTEEIKNADTPPIRLLVLLGMVQDASGQREAAIGTYRQVLEIDSEFVPVLNNLAWDLSESGQLEEALEIAARARKLAPTDPALADTYAWILHISGDSAGALPILRQALEGLPENRTIGLHLVEVLEAVGRTEEAKRQRELLDQDR